MNLRIAPLPQSNDQTRLHKSIFKTPQSKSNRFFFISGREDVSVSKSISTLYLLSDFIAGDLTSSASFLVLICLFSRVQVCVCVCVVINIPCRNLT